MSVDLNPQSLIDLSVKYAPSGDSDFSLALNVQFPDKGITAIYGPSGCGKTTLLRCMAGLVKTEQCRFSIDDCAIGDLPATKRQLGYVFQENRLFPHLTVEGNLDFAFKRRFSDNGPNKEQVIDWLDLEDLMERKPDQLSGGQKQRVAIGRALLSSPRCLLLDEPLAGIDSKASKLILWHLETVAANLNIPVIYVSHNLDEITRLADYLIIMDQGKLVADGPLLNILSRLDLDLAQQENAAMVLKTRIAGHDEEYSLTHLTWGIDYGGSLIVGQLSGEVGDRVRVRIPCRDVSIALEEPNQSSILNVLPGVISDIELVDDARAIVKTNVAGQSILARITRMSLDFLKLEKGKSVYLQIKTVALLSDTHG